MDVIRKEINSLMAQGKIREYNAPFAANMLIFGIKDSTKRVCAIDGDRDMETRSHFGRGENMCWADAIKEIGRMEEDIESVSVWVL